MLIEDYEIEMTCPQCHPGSESWVATVTTTADLRELMPYANAVVARGDYVPGIPTLVWKEGAHKVFLRAHQFGISSVRDRAEAQGEIERLVSFLNETWEERGQMIPNFSTRSKPKLFDILRYLPRTNCGQCGVPSCTAFAAMLSEAAGTLDECPPLKLDVQARNREKLVELGL